MIENKKAQAQIIVTVLIILIVISTISVVAVLVTRTVRQSAEQAEVFAKVSDIAVEELEVENGFAKIKISKGAKEGSVEQIKIVLKDDDGNSQIYTTTESMAPLESKDFIIPLEPELLDVSRVELYPVMEIGEEQKTGKIADYITNFKIKPAGLIGLWSFENNAEDSSGNDLHGNATGVSYVEGIIGQAVDLTGPENLVDLGSASEIEIKDKTIAFWANPNFINEDSNFIYHGSSREYVAFRYKDNITRFYYRYFNSSSKSVGVYNYNSISINDWSHYAVSVDVEGDRVIIKLYVNATNVKTHDRTDGFQETPRISNKIGSHINGQTYNYEGYLDEFRIYDRVLSVEEIEALYQQR